MQINVRVTTLYNQNSKAQTVSFAAKSSAHLPKKAPQSRISKNSINQKTVSKQNFKNSWMKVCYVKKEGAIYLAKNSNCLWGANMLRYRQSQTTKRTPSWHFVKKVF